MDKSLPSLSEAWGKQGQEPARPPWSAQQQSRQVPGAAEAVGELCSYRSQDKSSLQRGSRRADHDPGRVTVQLQPPHKLTLVTALIFALRQENVSAWFVLKFSIRSFVHSFIEYSANS